jgi:hypothetical protein
MRPLAFLRFFLAALLVPVISAPAVHADPAGPPRASTTNTSRAGFTAIVLDNGDVAIIGGRGIPSGQTVPAIEVVSGDSGQWRPSGALSLGRTYHTATALADGRVLIAGGQTTGPTGYGTTATTELFDPTRGSVTAGAPLGTPRHSHQAVRLADGRVLVAGDRYETRSTELWSPETGRWQPAGDLPAATSLHALVALPGGGAAVIGGMGVTYVLEGPTRVQRSVTLDDVLAWTPETAAWSPAARLGSRRTAASATVLGDGRVLVVGGADERRILRTAEICDLERGTCRPTGSLARPRSAHQAVTLASGEVAVIGGMTGPVGHSRPVLEIEIWSPRTGRWRQAKARIQQAHDVQVASLPGGDWLVLGLDPRCRDNCAPTTTRVRLR